MLRIFISLLFCNYLGQKVGDVNESASAAKGEGTENRGSKTLKFKLEEKELQGGEEVEIPVRSSNFNHIFGYQFTAKMEGMELTSMRAQTQRLPHKI